MTVVSCVEGGGESLTPRKFLEKFGLPRCARVYGEVPLLGQRVLLTRFYRSSRVEATLDGGIIVIPHLYDGWFSVVTERGQIKAKCFTTIQRLVTAQVTSFLTITDLTAYTLNSQRTSHEAKKQHYTKTTVRDGEVLKLLAVYQDIGHTGKSGKSSGASQEENRYAQCLTQAGQVVYIPVSTVGQFYATTGGGGLGSTGRREDTISRVYQLPRLLKTFPLPVRVCVINGCKAQGSMVLETIKTEEVILACSLGKENKLLEIDINSKFKLVDHQLKTTDQDIMAALQFTRLNWERWRRQMKIARDLYPGKGTEGGGKAETEPGSKPGTPGEGRGGHRAVAGRLRSQPLPPLPLQTELPYTTVRDSIEEPVYAEVTS